MAFCNRRVTGGGDKEDQGLVIEGDYFDEWRGDFKFIGEGTARKLG